MFLILCYIEEGESAQTGSVNGTKTANDTKSDGAKKKKTAAKKEKTEVKENVVKVNLTADVTVLDLPVPSEASTTVSTSK